MNPRTGRNRARAIAIARRRDPQSWLPWLAFAVVLLVAAAAAHAQQPDAPAVTQQAAPSTDAAPGSTSSTLSHNDGVIKPPAAVDPGMTIARPGADAFPTPTVRPPGTPGGEYLRRVWHPDSAYLFRRDACHPA